MQELKSFKKYSWLISGIFALIVFISGLTANTEYNCFLEYELKDGTKKKVDFALKIFAALSWAVLIIPVGCARLSNPSISE